MKLCRNCIWSKHNPFGGITEFARGSKLIIYHKEPDRFAKIKWVIHCAKCQCHNLDRFKSK